MNRFERFPDIFLMSQNVLDCENWADMALDGLLREKRLYLIARDPKVLKDFREGLHKIGPEHLQFISTNDIEFYFEQSDTYEQFMSLLKHADADEEYIDLWVIRWPYLMLFAEYRVKLVDESTEADPNRQRVDIMFKYHDDGHLDLTLKDIEDEGDQDGAA